MKSKEKLLIERDRLRDELTLKYRKIEYLSNGVLSLAILLISGLSVLLSLYSMSNNKGGLSAVITFLVVFVILFMGYLIAEMHKIQKSANDLNDKLREVYSKFSK